MIEFEPQAPAHLPAIEALLTDPAILRFTLVPEPVPEGFAAEWLDWYEQGRRSGEREGFAIVEDGAFLGLALAPAIADGTVELGYVVAPAGRGRGLAPAALRMLTDWAFADRGVVRAELRISASNGASQRVAEKAGYIREGVLRSVHFKQGRRDDMEIWSRLPTDP